MQAGLGLQDLGDGDDLLSEPSRTSLDKLDKHWRSLTRKGIPLDVDAAAKVVMWLR